MVRTCSAAAKEDVGGVLEEKNLVEEAESRWDLQGLSNWDFPILNHRNEEEEMRRSYLEGPPCESGGVLRVLLGALCVCMMGFFYPLPAWRGPVLLTGALFPGTLTPSPYARL